MAYICNVMHRSKEIAENSSYCASPLVLQQQKGALIMEFLLTKTLSTWNVFFNSRRLITFTVLLLFTSVFLFTGCDQESITQVEPMLETVETRNELSVPELLADKDDPENDKVEQGTVCFCTCGERPLYG